MKITKSMGLAVVNKTTGESTPINLALKVSCDAHRALFKRLGLNEVYTTNAMMSMTLNKACGDLKDEDGPEAFVAALQGIAATNKPLCCMLSADEMDAMIADAPASTGDERADYEEAAHAIPGVKPASVDDIPDEVKEEMLKLKDRIEKD